MGINLPVIAGAVSTTLFAISTLPMVVKAYRTKDLKSYSMGYLLLGNAGNVFHSVYVYDMPPGPIWLLHTFYLIVTGLMLFWYLRYEWLPGRQRHNRAAPCGYLPVHQHTPLKYPVWGMPVNIRWFMLWSSQNEKN